MNDVDGLITAYSLTEPYFMLGSVLAEYLGIAPSFCASLTVGGATPGIALHQGGDGRGHRRGRGGVGDCR